MLKFLAIINLLVVWKSLSPCCYGEEPCSDSLQLPTGWSSHFSFQHGASLPSSPPQSMKNPADSQWGIAREKPTFFLIGAQQRKLNEYSVYQPRIT
jgi:hypothetical protein